MRVRNQPFQRAAPAAAGRPPRGLAIRCPASSKVFTTGERGGSTKQRTGSGGTTKQKTTTSGTGGAARQAEETVGTAGTGSKFYWSITGERGLQQGMWTIGRGQLHEGGRTGPLMRVR